MSSPTICRSLLFCVKVFQASQSFSSNGSSTDLISSEEDDPEDDLEIPAFLRRQKN